VYRSFTVRGPPLEIDSYQDVVYYIFNFKANPSTTGLRHRGYVKFFKPQRRNPKNVPLQNLECLVDCTCPDFRYRWAWANKQRQSSVVGPQSLNQAWNRAPRKTNPKGKPGLCKHILATREHIYGMLSSFPGDTPDTASKLDQLTRYATKRWTDFEGQMQAAREREAEIRRRRNLRNIGQVPVQPPAAPVPVRTGAQPPSINAPARMPAEQKPKATTDLKGAEPEPLPSPLAVPPGQRGRTMPGGTPPSTELAIPPGERGRSFPTPVTNTPTKPKRVLGNRTVKPMEARASGWIRSHEAAFCLPLRNLILESVVKTNGESMSTINEAIKLVSEMEADELDHIDSGAPPTDMDVGSDIGGDTLQPSEPPVSDSAIGADTEGDSALSLLRSMKNALEQIAAAVAPIEELPPGAEAGEGAAGGAGAMPMPDEPPSDLEAGAGAAEAGAAEAEEGEAEEDEERAEEDEERAEVD